MGLPAVSTAEEDMMAIAEFGAWSLFKDSDDCWVAAYAKGAATQWLLTDNNDRPNLGIGGVTPAMTMTIAA